MLQRGTVEQDKEIGEGKLQEGFCVKISLLGKNWRALEAASTFTVLRFIGSLLRSVQELSGAPAARWRKKVSFLTLTLKFLD